MISQKIVKLDPRTKLLMCFTSAVIMFGSGGDTVRIMQYCCAAVPLIAMLCLKKYAVSLWYGGMFLLAVMYPVYIMPHLPKAIGTVFAVLSAVYYQAVPGMSMFAFIIFTTTVSEFISAMEKMRIPKTVCVPISVMFRFFPAIAEEYRYIRSAMKMRGISGRTPQLFLEYRLVPLMTAVLNIGGDLSASALSRGLDSPKKRTNACVIGFNPVDIALMLICVSGIGLYIYTKAVNA
jgi:energy-coupling factor transport system permease protein